MTKTEFKAYIVKEAEGKFYPEIKSEKLENLTDNDVLINVKYSSLNYKDALSATGNKGITKKYPHIPGIDAAGIVVSSKSERFSVGEKVIVTGYDLGMNTPGGFAEFIKVPEGWIVKKPANLSLKESMILGTAGFTAALAISKLQTYGLKSLEEEILVTGATGSLGSLAIKILSRAGYKNIVAATGKTDKSEFLISLGANQVIDRNKSEIDDKSNKALLRGRWGGVIDSVGGNILATAIKSTKRGGVVAACGLTQSFQFYSTVYPFILRGVNLVGIDSAECPMDYRTEIWKKLSGDWKINTLNYMYEEVSLRDLEQKIRLMIEGRNTGRIIVNLEK